VCGGGGAQCACTFTQCAQCAQCACTCVCLGGGGGLVFRLSVRLRVWDTSVELSG
jgi:hypothetical protein